MAPTLVDETVYTPDQVYTNDGRRIVRNARGEILWHAMGGPPTSGNRFWKQGFFIGKGCGTHKHMHWHIILAGLGYVVGDSMLNLMDGLAIAKAIIFITALFVSNYVQAVVEILLARMFRCKPQRVIIWFFGHYFQSTIAAKPMTSVWIAAGGAATRVGWIVLCTIGFALKEQHLSDDECKDLRRGDEWAYTWEELMSSYWRLNFARMLSVLILKQQGTILAFQLFIPVHGFSSPRIWLPLLYKSGMKITKIAKLFFWWTNVCVLVWIVYVVYVSITWEEYMLCPSTGFKTKGVDIFGIILALFIIFKNFLLISATVTDEDLLKHVLFRCINIWRQEISVTNEENPVAPQEMISAAQSPLRTEKTPISVAPSVMVPPPVITPKVQPQDDNPFLSDDAEEPFTAVSEPGTAEVKAVPEQQNDWSDNPFA